LTAGTDLRATPRDVRGDEGKKGTAPAQYFSKCSKDTKIMLNPLNAELNPICHLLTLLGAHHIFHVSGLRVKHCFGSSTIIRGFLRFARVKQSHYRPGQAPEGSRKLRFPGFVTTAQDGGTVVSLTHRPPLPPGNTPGIHFC